MADQIIYLKQQTNAIFSEGVTLLDDMVAKGVDVQAINFGEFLELTQEIDGTWTVTATGGSASLHFGAYTNDTIAVSVDPNAPTHLAGLSLFPSSSSDFTIITDGGGTQWIRNDSAKSFSMQGTVTYQTIQGTGGSAQLKLWSERSTDDGATFTENSFSLRTSDVANNTDNSQTKSSGVDMWAPGESIRWAMYNAGPGSLTLNGPTDTVNGGKAVEGLTFYWQLNATS